MIVVGGTYRERCDNPPMPALGDNVIGSGVRAAAVLRAVEPDLTLITAVDEGMRDEAELVTGALQLQTRFARRSTPVGFTYFTPISPPLINGRLARLTEPLSASSDTALVFGMIEAGDDTRPHVSAEALVLDPQQPRDLVALDTTPYSGKRLAIVANSAETRALGKSAHVAEAARSLRDATDADVVVTKRGARGALVTTAGSQENIGPIPTERVWPIGSGDVYAAVFAWAWGRLPHDPVDAAHIASSATASWAASHLLDQPADVFKSRPSDELAPRDARVYLAAPFFTLGERWLVELVRDALHGLGVDVFSPLHDVGVGDTEVAKKDIAGLERCGAVLALLDGGDAGTIFETGWATRHKLPVVCYASDAGGEATKMLVGTGAELHRDVSTAVYRAAWAAMGMPLR